MCIKLVIKTNLYYDARSEKHQTYPVIKKKTNWKACVCLQNVGLHLGNLVPGQRVHLTILILNMLKCP
jgi:predicted  nucleic acid-binding Zn ribbon protein